LTDPRSGKVLARIYPLDRALNADRLRRSLQVIDNAPEAENTTAPRNEVAPLLRKLIADYSATGLPPAYLPKTTLREDS